MRRLARNLTVVPGAFLLAALTLTSCGKDDSKDEPVATPGIKAEVVAFASGKAEVGFSDAQADQQYILMPISLGDPASIKGGSDETFAFKIAAPAGSKLHFQRGIADPKPMSALDREHGVRRLLNVFDPAKGEAQVSGFWDLARRVDGESVGGFLQGATGPVESYFRKLGAAQLSLSRSFAATTAGGCPAVGDDVVIMDVEDTSDTDTVPIQANNVVSGDDYCIVYLSEPVTGGTRAEVEATVKTTLARYKSVIYKNDFAAVGGYTFKPIVVVMDFGNEAIWPQSLQIGGAFVSLTSNEAKQPMLYMPADLEAVSPYKDQANYDEALGKLNWHATIAHEMQHAIMSYFRTKVTTDGTEDIGSIDEGLAHYMEDLFGYGSEQFSQVAKPFLENWGKNQNPPIHATESSLMERGAAQTFLYYLTSQKGGIKFTDGVVSGGGGLDFIGEIVKNAGGKSGPANLAAKFGGDWLQTVANYFGALAIDHTALDADAALEVQAPESIKDMNGGTAKEFGMRFNDFGGLSATPWATWEEKVGTTEEVETSYYATSPVLYTVADPAAKVTFTTEVTAANTAVIKVRVK